MAELFLYALNAVLSILLISAIGFALKKTGRVEESFVKKLNAFAFRYLVPLQLFISIYSISDIDKIDSGILVFIALYVVAAFVVGMAASLIISPDNSKRGAIAQSFFRSNTAIMGVPLAELLGGMNAVAYISVMMSVTVILYNVFAVIALTIFAPKDNKGKKIEIGSLLLDIVKNPLIQGVAAGLVCLLLRAFIPRDAGGELVFSLNGSMAPLFNALNSLSKASSPLMLLVIGMQFEFKSASAMKKEIFSAVFARTVFVPTLAFVALYYCSSVWRLFTAEPAAYQACIGVVAAPCAIASAVMTAEMGGDGELAGQIVVWSTVVSVFTIFGFITVLRYLGLM